MTAKSCSPINKGQPTAPKAKSDSMTVRAPVDHRHVQPPDVTANRGTSPGAFSTNRR